MTTIIYIPLDERPVNLVFPQNLVETNEEIELLVPPIELLGKKKQPANLTKLWSWLEEQAPRAERLLCSLDMLLYGGIVPSRLHHLNQAEAQASLHRLTRLKTAHPRLKIYAFNLIMRVPAYNSSDEEPDYYAQHGEQIFRWGWLTDELSRGRANGQKEAELEQVQTAIPEPIRTDYSQRRRLNHFVNRQAIELVDGGILDFLVIPLDDCAEYGFSAAEQRILLQEVERRTLQDQVHIYPGADEIGSTLLCRIINELNKARPRVYVRYSSTMGPNVIPRYEDRPLGESIKSQITVCGGVMVDHSSEADLVLMVNSPTLNDGQMQEASDAVYDKDTSYYSFRNLREFSENIRYHLDSGKRVALADVAFGNGADHELMRMLSKQGLLPRLHSFAAWNTPGNTLGTVLSHALLRLHSAQESLASVDKFVLDRYVEDWGYQALVRRRLGQRGEELNITYFDLGNEAARISSLALEELQEFIETYLPEYKDHYSLDSLYFPWNRLFEIGFASSLR